MIGRCNEWDTNEEQEEKLFDEHRKTSLHLICKPLPHTAHGIPSELMRSSQAEMTNAYASDVTRLLSFRKEGRRSEKRQSIFTDRPQGSA